MLSVVFYFVMMDTVLTMEPSTQDLVTPLKQLGEACGYESCPDPKAGVLNVHLVPHTHAEMGYTRTFHQHYTGYDDFYDRSNLNMKRILDFVISELWARTERTFALSDLPYFFHWWANRDETVRRMVYQLLRQGRLSLVGGGWGMPDEATTSYHALIDQFTYSLRKINATFLECARPLVTWQADTYAHSREFSALMAQMAFDGHFISPISYDDELQRMRERGLEMLWRGSDDLGQETDMFTHKLFDGYWSPPGFCFGSLCSDPLLISSDSQFRNTDERATVFLESMLQRQSPHYATSHVLVVMGKRFAYHDAPVWFHNIETLIHAVNSKGLGKVHLFYSSPACYLKAVHNSNPVLPIKQADFVPIAYDKENHLTGLFTSRPAIKYMVREGHVFLQIAKQLQVLARLPQNDKIFEEFNWIMGALQDHNVISGSMRDHVKQYYTRRAYIAVQRASLLLKEAFNKLRNCASATMYYRCDFNISSCRVTSRSRYFIVVYNPLSWPVSMPIRLPVGNVTHYMYTIIDPNQEKVKPAIVKLPKAVMRIPNRFTQLDHELVFLSQDIPALGYRSYFVERHDKEPNNETEKRIQRAITIKINKNKNKKYLIRQTNLKIDDESLLNNVDPNREYDEYDDDTTQGKIEVTNVTTTTEYKDDLDTLTTKPVVTTDYFEEEQVTRTTKATTTEATTTTVLNDLRENNDMYVSSDDKFISNKYINITLDSSKEVARVTLSNGVNIDLKIQLLFYASDDPHKMGRGHEKQPGAYIFKTMDPKPMLINDNNDVEVVKTDVVEELHVSKANYAGFSVKLYAEKPVIEIDWVVGPIPIDDGVGKDVFVRYGTDLKNEGVFFTDSNGRQTMKRIRNSRADYNSVNAYTIPGNIYPVTSKIYIEDLEKNIRFSVFNDRAQGGTSLNEGQIDLMLHRRILTDDSGIQAFLNDTEFGQGVVIRGRHYLYVSKANYKPHRIFEKKFAKEIELSPQILVSNSNPYYNRGKEVWLLRKNEFSFIKHKLPIGIHLLTLQEWNNGALLIRFENYIEKSDAVRDGVKIVFIKDVFVNIKVKSVRETTLDGNKWLKDWVPLNWRKKEEFYMNFNDAYGGNGTRQADSDAIPVQEANIDAGIKFSPQQIRTFVVSFEYIDI